MKKGAELGAKVTVHLGGKGPLKGEPTKPIKKGDPFIIVGTVVSVVANWKRFWRQMREWFGKKAQAWRR